MLTPIGICCHVVRKRTTGEECSHVTKSAAKQSKAKAKHICTPTTHALSTMSYSSRMRIFPRLLVLLLLLLDSRNVQGSDSDSSLVFHTDCTLRSDPLPLSHHHDKQALFSFFQQESTRNLLVSGGGRRPCRQVPVTPQIETLWKRACDAYYGPERLPQPSDVAMATETETSFPGFTFQTLVLNGCKLYNSNSKATSPSYEFCLIGDRKTLRGSPPIVWLVQKLTGHTPQNDFQLSETRAISRVSIVDNMFQIDIQLTTTVHFPKLFLRLLPASKEKVEERGTQSVTKAVVKDAGNALSAVQEAWLQQLSQSRSDC